MATRDTRTAIIDAAIGLFSERGFEAVSTREIARVVGIASPSIYKHFASIDDIVSEALRISTQRRAAPYRQVLEAGGPAAERLKAVVIAMIAGFQRDPGLVHLYQQLLAARQDAVMAQVSALWEEDMQPALIGLIAEVAPGQDAAFAYYVLFSFVLGQALFGPVHERLRPLTPMQRDPAGLAEAGLRAALPQIDWPAIAPAATKA